MLVITYCVNEYLILASNFLQMFCNSHVPNCFLFKMLFGSRIFFRTFLGKEFSLQILRKMNQFCYIITSKQKLVQQKVFHENKKIFFSKDLSNVSFEGHLQWENSRSHEVLAWPKPKPFFVLWENIFFDIADISICHFSL